MLKQILIGSFLLLLMIHGQLDTVVPYSQGLELFSHANQTKQWIEFPNKGHHDLWDAYYAREVMNFIQSHCIA